MPGLNLFNRRWNIASDDLFYPGLAELIFRSAWFLPQLFYYTKYQESFHCSDVTLLHVYYLGYLCIMSAVLFVQFFIVQISSRGTITNVHPRRHINKFLYIRTFLVFTEFIWSVIGIIWLAKTKWNVCSSLVYFTVLANIIFCALAIILLNIILLFIFDPISHLPEGDIQRKNILYEWLRTIFCCCYCCLYTGNSRRPNYENSYKQISSLLEHLFRGGNMTPSDVLAGIILKSNKEPDQYNREFINFKKAQALGSLSKNNRNLKIDQIPKWMSVNEACYYIKYAVATYSWPYYLYMHNMRGFCDLCCSSRTYLFPCCCGTATIESSTDDPSHLVIHGDSKSRHHLKAFKFLSKVQECDLIYANFQNELFLVPFCILIDHYKKTVVITIRGTLSMRDVITDITADCGSLNIDNLTNQACHLGILNTAENIYNRIKSQNLLEEAFRHNPNYQLLVTGHSLGAGTAAILALKMKSEYPNIRCIAYSPPGGLISTALADLTKTFIMSVVVGDDIVPRLSVHSVHNLKADILKEIYNTSLPKYKIIWKYSLSFVKDTPLLTTNESDDDALSSIESITNKDDLDNSLNSATSRNLLLEYDSGPDQSIAKAKNNYNNNFENLIEIDEANETDTTNAIVKAEVKKLKSGFRPTLDKNDRISEESNDENHQPTIKSAIIAFTAAKEMMSKVYDTYTELQIPGNILYIYQIRANQSKTKSSCNCCRKTCAKVCFCFGVCGSKSNRNIQYDTRWASNEEFKKILITNRMLMDHFPNTVVDALSYFNTTDRLVV